jgi:hypothetical protein
LQPSSVGLSISARIAEHLSTIGGEKMQGLQWLETGYQQALAKRIQSLTRKAFDIDRNKL